MTTVQRARAVLYDADRHDAEVDLRGELVGGLGERQLLWIDVDACDADELARVASLLALRHETTSALRDERHSHGIAEYDDYVHVEVLAIADRDDAALVPFDCVVGRGWVLTAHLGPVRFLRRLDDRVRGDTAMGLLDPAAFLHMLLAAHLTTFLDELERVEREIDRLDESVLTAAPEETLLEDLVAARRHIASVRRALAPHREIFASLAQPQFELLPRPGSQANFKELNDRLESAIEAAEHAREMVIGSFEIFMTQTAHRTNEVMKLLTVTTVVLLPPSLIAAILGMSLHPGFFADGSLFWAALAVMAVVAVVPLWLARRKGWI